MDIDIDVKSSFVPKDVFDIVHASIVENGDLRKHPAGVYFQIMPVDYDTNLAAIPYDKAEELGYFKIDMLHLSLLNNFVNKAEIKELLKQEPDWAMLEDKNIVTQLFQIKKHFDVVSQVKPTSVEELADVLALIRPNKRNLLEAYLKARKTVREKYLYVRDEGDRTSFRKSHAIAYALTIKLQMNYLKINSLYEY